MTTRTFLVVDDDCEDSELFSEAMNSVDSTVSCLNAETGRVAFETMAGHCDAMPDIIFLDINMPIMNGWQFLAKLKATELLKNIPVIMYSTSSKGSDMKAAMAAGALCFFTKPDTFQRLRKILQIVLAYMAMDKLDQVCPAIQAA